MAAAVDRDHLIFAASSTRLAPWDEDHGAVTEAVER
jgi:hypothetical protein